MFYDDENISLSCIINNNFFREGFKNSFLTAKNPYQQQQLPITLPSLSAQSDPPLKKGKEKVGLKWL